MQILPVIRPLSEPTTPQPRGDWKLPLCTALQPSAEIAPSFVLFCRSSLLTFLYLTWSNTTWKMWCPPILCNDGVFPQKWIDFHLCKSDSLESVSVPKATRLCFVKQDLLVFYHYWYCFIPSFTLSGLMEFTCVIFCSKILSFHSIKIGF